ncbi:MAG: S-methyl-5'-thioadenosine phosphorylase [Chloroflexi bacterium]|nr:S-methyl-5'-thioadenosine phosphorylase [Chloroflexota bacterium]
MDTAIIGVIGGSGLYAMDGLSDVKEVKITSPFGDPSDVITLGTFGGQRIAFLPRHGRGHRLTPSEVPYRANIFALKTLGVQWIVAVSACGSLREEFAPRDIVIPDQIYDHTKGRAGSFFGNGAVAHVSFADPFCSTLSGILYDAVKEAGGRVHKGGKYLTIEGPQFSSKAESNTYRQWGMDIIGMTNVPESRLAREAEICYATMAHVTDYDVWHQSAEPVTLPMVIANLNANVALAQKALAVVFNRLPATREQCACPTALKDAIVTDPARIPAKFKDDLRPITGKYLG